MSVEQPVREICNVLDSVYGKYDSSKPWVPQAYTENKGRYLWTDAFGVCSYISLFHVTRRVSYLDQADALIRNVHDVLGKNRAGTHRLGHASEMHPTKGGLRIGKEDEEGTPDGDGQYFHYLTKWMFALSRMSVACSDSQYLRWAIELAQAIHPHFVYRRESGRPRMYWKISIDLSHPHVASEGNLDPYDGLVTYSLLRDLSGDPSVLRDEIQDMQKIVNSKYKSYSSHDPLDLGEALWLAHWYSNEEWAKFVGGKSLHALEELWELGYFEASSKHRLAFREFGTTLGVQVWSDAQQIWGERVDKLHSFWRSRLNTRDNDITPIMFCSSLLPGVMDKHFVTQGPAAATP